MGEKADEALAIRFEENRNHLRAVAYRMLGSRSEADDAVQEAWLRLSRADATEIENLRGWLTTVVARVCLDTLRTRKSRREETGADLPEPSVSQGDAVHPESEALLADSVGLALLIVLDTLEPAERLAFVLHDLFAVPFDEIAPIVGRTPAAARQLASRARRRVQSADNVGQADRSRRQEIVSAFLAAARGGNFEALLALLDPDVVLRSDPTAAATGAEAELRGAEAVARTFAGRARAAHLALVDGAAGAAWAPGGQPRVVFAFAIAGDKIAGIEILADPDQLAQMSVDLLD